MNLKTVSNLLTKNGFKFNNLKFDDYHKEYEVYCSTKTGKDWTVNLIKFFVSSEEIPYPTVNKLMDLDVRSMSYSGHPSFEPLDYIDSTAHVNLTELKDLELLDKFFSAYTNPKAAQDLYNLLHKSAYEHYQDLIVYKDDLDTPKIMFDSHVLELVQTKCQYNGARKEVLISTSYDILTKVFKTRINFSENHMYDREFPTKFLDGIISKEDADVLINKFFNKK